MEFWQSLFDIGALLAVAFVFGAICERLRQSTLLGYLLAGMLLGPNALHLVKSSAEVDGLAEVGVSFLLFTLGLEFSVRRLRALGRTAFFGGLLQITGTLVAFLAGGLLLGLSLGNAVVVGAAFALSSTAGVLRVLSARSELDSQHGRQSLGILLFQDLAVVPLVLLVELTGADESGSSALWGIGRAALLLMALAAGYYVVFSLLMPRVLLATSALRNRELPILLAVVGALWAVHSAHSLGISPAVGAFIAGMLLGESPFAAQIRADLSVLRTLLVTIFFTSVGMLADPAWILAHIGPTLLVAAAVLSLKTLVCYVALRAVGQGARISLAAALCLSQVGEFAFVIVESAPGGMLDENLAMIIVSTMMLTLLVTPYLIASAPRISARMLPTAGRAAAADSSVEVPEGAGPLADHVLLVGFGPAGEQCARTLGDADRRVVVLDLNPALVRRAKSEGYEAHLGDGTHPEVLEHLRAASAAAVVITLPDPGTAERAARAAFSLSDRVPVVVRGRYNRFIRAWKESGIRSVVDEEQEVGRLLAEQVAPAAPEEGRE